MQLNELKPKNTSKKRKRIGRGGKRGGYSGRGQKGQKSRAGRKFQPIVRALIKRYPKLRGYKFNPKKKNREINILNLDILEKKFEDGEKITPEALVGKKIIRKEKGKMPIVKILGNGELTKKFFIENCFFSKKAKELIEKTGGTITAKIPNS